MPPPYGRASYRGRLAFVTRSWHAGTTRRFSTYYTPEVAETADKKMIPAASKSCAVDSEWRMQDSPFDIRHSSLAQAGGFGVFDELLPERIERLGDDPAVADDVHEIRVARPSRHDMGMQVTGPESAAGEGCLEGSDVA